MLLLLLHDVCVGVSHTHVLWWGQERRMCPAPALAALHTLCVFVSGPGKAASAFLNSSCMTAALAFGQLVAGCRRLHACLFCLSLCLPFVCAGVCVAAYTDQHTATPLQKQFEHVCSAVWFVWGLDHAPLLPPFQRAGCCFFIAFLYSVERLPWVCACIQFSAVASVCHHLRTPLSSKRHPPCMAHNTANSRHLFKCV